MYSPGVVTPRKRKSTSGIRGDSPKRSRVHSISVVSDIFPLDTAQQRLAAATHLARELDSSHRLDESKTVVERPDQNIPSSPDIFIHTNADSTYNRYLAEQSAKQGEKAALRTLYDGFFHECGYVSAWNRHGESLYLPSSLTHCVDISHPTPQTKSRKASVWAARGRFPNFSTRDLKYLAGDDSEYKILHESHHTCPLRAIAILVERYLRDKSIGRNEAIRKMFTYVTGYETFKEAYQNETETRLVTSEGLIEEDIVTEDEGED
jgi:hypothetical protein